MRWINEVNEWDKWMSWMILDELIRRIDEVNE